MKVIEPAVFAESPRSDAEFRPLLLLSRLLLLIITWRRRRTVGPLPLPFTFTFLHGHARGHPFNDWIFQTYVLPILSHVSRRRQCFSTLFCVCRRRHAPRHLPRHFSRPLVRQDLPVFTRQPVHLAHVPPFLPNNLHRALAKRRLSSGCDITHTHSRTSQCLFHVISSN